ncbi:MAG TPA: zinc-dependent alcohol dehydrogenase [Abditibacteriaceae bacterium]|jgi:threonine dehydrogenase-like Zn-dependent dehydrogenase
MKAICFAGKNHVSVNEVPDPKIEHPRDAVIKISTTAICGSDIHLYDGLIQTLEYGDILGHEFMGEVVELGSGVTNLQIGDRVVVPFTIACGDCWFCKKQLFAACDTSNPNAELPEKLYGASPSGLFGFSHMYGGFAGGQAQYARVPFADVGPLKVNNDLPDEKVLFLSDIFPTGWMAAENCQIEKGDTVAIWGAGPVGQMAIRSAFLMGAGKVISIDNIPERLAMAAEAGAITINFKEDDEKNLFDQLKDLTEGRGPDSCLDAVGMEAHGTSPGEIYDWIKMGLRMATDRPNVFRQAIQACRKGGTVSVPGVYAGFLDKIPFGAAFNKGLTIKCGQTHMQKYMQPLLEMIEQGKIDPSFVITHRLPLASAPDAYEVFKWKKDNCIKVVMKPWEDVTDGKIRTFDNANDPAPTPPNVAQA